MLMPKIEESDNNNGSQKETLLDIKINGENNEIQEKMLDRDS